MKECTVICNTRWVWLVAKIGNKLDDIKIMH